MPDRSRRRSLAAAAALLPVLATAPPAPAAPADPAPWLTAATAADLASDREWRQLVHYYTPPARPWQTRNFVDDPRFFLAPAGARDPAAELAATVTGLLADPGVQCRFPARTLWLTHRLPGLAGALPPADCPDYAGWRSVLGVREVVLVFAASYLNSPSSMYGHTFLRLDSGSAGRDVPMLAWALNFGATIPPDEPGIVYAWRGLFGGYPGQFAAGPYFEKLREYSRLESRDLWEYRLDLDAGEIERLLAHAWELRDITFDYYFFDENCSLRLLELLDVARPGHDLADRFPNYAIPIDTVRAVIDAGFVAGVTYRPATRTALRAGIAALTPAEQRLARSLSASATAADSPDFAALAPERRQRVVNVAYQHFRDRAVRSPPGPELTQQNFALLTLLNRTAGPAAPDPVPTPTAPEDGHRTGLVAAAVGREEDRAVGDLEWRLSYHDLLDREAGYPAGASLNMGRLVARWKEGGTVQLQRFDLLEITSLAARDAFFAPWSWRVNAGLDRQWTAGDDVLVPQVNAGFGGTWALGQPLTVYAFATGRLEWNHVLDRQLDLAPGLAIGARLAGRAGVTQFAADRYRFTDGIDRTFLALRHNLPLGRNLALRLHLERTVTETDRVDEYGLALRYHF